MPNKLTIMSKVKQILQAYTEGVSKSMISKKTGVSCNTVKRFIREFIAMDKSLEEILSMSDSALELLFKANPTHELRNQISMLGYKVFYASTAKLFALLKMAKADGQAVARCDWRKNHC